MWQSFSLSSTQVFFKSILLVCSGIVASVCSGAGEFFTHNHISMLYSSSKKNEKLTTLSDKLLEMI